MGVPEAQIAEILINQNSPMNPLDSVPMGVAVDDGMNIPYNTAEMQPAITGLGPQEPSQEAINAGITADINDPSYGAPAPIAPSMPSVVQQQQAQQPAIGGPGYPVEPQQGMQTDPFGSFAAGFSSAPHVPYSGGMQQIAAMMGNGSMAMRREMSDMRRTMRAPSSVREFEYARDQGYEGNFTDYKRDFGGNVFGQMMQQMAMQNQLGQQQWQRGQATSKAEIAAGEREYRKGQDQSKAEIAADEKLYRKEQHVIAQTQKLDKAVPQEMKEMQNALDNIRIAVEPYEEDDSGNVDLPGFGKVEGSVPGFAVGRDATDMRATVGALRNTILKARSGGAVSDGEAGRMLEELAMGSGKGEVGMLKAFNRIQKDFNKIMRTKYNSYSPEVVDRHLGRPYEESPPVYNFKPAQKDIDAELKRRGL